MPSAEEQIRDLGWKLPTPIAAPPDTEVRLRFVTRHDRIAFISGHGPADGGRRLMRGTVGTELSTDEGREAARLCALSMLASLQQELGTVNRVRSWLKVLGFVKCVPGYQETPLVMNGFSDVIAALWPENGLAARSAIGVSALPFDVPVEVEAVVELV